MAGRRASLGLGLWAALALAPACVTGAGYYNGYGNVTVGGSEGNGRMPPVGYQCYPRYRVRGGYAYDVYGRYYKVHDGNWSAMRGAPAEVRYETPVVTGGQGCGAYPP